MSPPKNKEKIELITRQTSYPHPIAFLSLASFFLTWTSSPLVPPLCLVSSITRYSDVPMVALLAYYGYRTVKPCKPWSAILNIYGKAMMAGYWRKQAIILKDGQHVQPTSKTMLCFRKFIGSQGETRDTLPFRDWHLSNSDILSPPPPPPPFILTFLIQILMEHWVAVGRYPVQAKHSVP